MVYSSPDFNQIIKVISGSKPEIPLKIYKGITLGIFKEHWNRDFNIPNKREFYSGQY